LKPVLSSCCRYHNAFLVREQSELEEMGSAHRASLAIIVCAIPCTWALKRGELRNGGSINITYCSTSMSFSEFVDKYKRDYKPGTEEYRLREILFAKRLAAVDQHNCEQRKRVTWRASINNLADWSDEALESLSSLEPGRKGEVQKEVQAPPPPPPPYVMSLRHPAPGNFPESLSWGNLSDIQLPKHQGHCGSCWALSAVTVLNAHSEIRKQPNDFSLAQVVACTPNPNKCGGTGGCHGATAGLAFNYALHAGLVSAGSFPYPFGDPEFRGDSPACPLSMAVDAEKASQTLLGIHSTDGTDVHKYFSGRGRDFGLVGWKRLPENREEQIVRALVHEGPMAVSVATGPSWHMYAAGVLPAEECDQKHVLRHAVVLFGYGVEKLWDLRYWSLKNSWGADWGERGNMRLQRLDNEEVACGWDYHPEKGSECAGGRDKIWVCGSCGILHEATMPIFE